ncbi:transcriptional regulator NrdR [Dethiobacter alkaliphilus]|uniref:Transcriptional repressor NrdR n=1 Tax=Dethiobacter alkaliphilus AHT 1 TaxID=555088 RepID=C0GFS1_DETAL|nr:transcriptional regulator NrdR [Dethiobacter alkaliphilus]EEG77610.1 ATP-cone domain protein [Dethiobacter alkaliphilus AHT 1]MCW3491218.1 transcriptional regulator NrdR [Dethiobacter alkaliphilus]
MKCPYCGCVESRVIDSRSTDEGGAIRRRRECTVCEKRFTTYEKVDETPVIVVKRDGSRQMFDRTKILNGLIYAGGKRKIPLEVFENLVDDLERELRSANNHEVSSDEVGQRVLAKLRDIDEVAYVRFASVYYKFRDIDDFRKALAEMP